MEMEKLRGSERSVCAGITARFIAARDGQIRHKTGGKNPAICRAEAGQRSLKGSDVRMQV